MKAGAISAMTAGAFNVVGGAATNGWSPLEKIAAHGLVGGAASVASGGKFGSGFLAAAFGEGMTPVINKIDFGTVNPLLAHTAMVSLVGGTASVIGGGKFGEGAVTAAFGYLFNQVAHAADGRQSRLGRSLTADERALYGLFFPDEILNTVQVYEGKVPWWVRSDMDGITLGNKVYFRQDVYVPDTAPGVEILGHEITHVEQYANGMSYASYIWASRNGYANNPYEIEAYAKGATIRSSYCRSNPGKTGC